MIRRRSPFPSAGLTSEESHIAVSTANESPPGLTAEISPKPVSDALDIAVARDEYARTDTVNAQRKIRRHVDGAIMPPSANVSITPSATHKAKRVPQQQAGEPTTVATTVR